jgi:hypothetical protein
MILQVVADSFIIHAHDITPQVYEHDKKLNFQDCPCELNTEPDHLKTENERQKEERAEE